jgi:hypothetical protein
MKVGESEVADELHGMNNRTKMPRDQRLENQRSNTLQVVTATEVKKKIMMTKKKK